LNAADAADSNALGIYHQLCHIHNSCLTDNGQLNAKTFSQTSADFNIMGNDNMTRKDLTNNK